MTADELQAFEQRVAEAFNAGQIRAPVHLAGGNEEQLIAIFADIRPQDWILAQWRSHYHCLLKGIPPEVLFQDILAGRSITLCYPDYRILTSAIVGGILPIAVGIAWAIKRAGRDERVWAFMGDMTARAGIAAECFAYALGHELPIRFVVEDNGLSVCSPTAEAWGTPRTNAHELWVRYEYKLPFPHSGAGKRINF